MASHANCHHSSLEYSTCLNEKSPSHTDAAIVRVLVDLAHRLSMEVVAEGVETDWQLSLLRELDCEYAQGYLLARPLDPVAAGQLLSVGVLNAA